MAEIYGIDYPGQMQIAGDVRQVLQQTPGVVDVDDSTESESARWVIKIDRQKATRLGLDQASIANAIATLVDGENVGYLHRDNQKYPLPLRLELAEGDKVKTQPQTRVNVAAIRQSLWRQMKAGLGRIQVLAGHAGGTRVRVLLPFRRKP